MQNFKKEVEGYVEELREGLFDVQLRTGELYKPQSRLEKKISSVWHHNFYPFCRRKVKLEKISEVLRKIFPRDSKEASAQKLEKVLKGMERLGESDQYALKQVIKEEFLDAKSLMIRSLEENRTIVPRIKSLEENRAVAAEMLMKEGIQNAIPICHFNWAK